jgi:hypothetical protein
MTVKNLFENEELLNDIVEDIDEIPEDTEVFYAVWALGYDENDDPTDDEVLVGEFTDPDEAIKLAKKATVEQVKELGFGEPDSNTTYFSIEVETVIADPDDEDGGTMNIGTIYKKDLWIDNECSSEETVDPVVELKSPDFTITEEGELKISCELLKDFNKNDYVRFRFLDEAEAGTFLYKIMSKVEYADGDYYHCDMEL